MNCLYPLLTFMFGIFSIGSWAANHMDSASSIDIPKTVEVFQSQGGKGVLLSIDDFISETEKKIAGFYLTQLPKSPRKNSAFKWLRTQDSYNLVADLMKLGACIFIVDIPMTTGNLALTIGIEYPGVLDLIKKVKAPIKNKSIVFIRPDATKDSIAHEIRHWLDTSIVDETTSRTMASAIENDILDIFNLNLGLEKKDFTYLNLFIIEQRGYATQQLSLETDSVQNFDYVPDYSSKTLVKLEATAARTRASRLTDEVFFDKFPIHVMQSILDGYLDESKHGNLQKRILGLFEKYQIRGYRKLEIQTMFGKYYPISINTTH